MTADPNLLDRLQRADSWIKAAAKFGPDQRHEAFISYYIAFNCLYGRRRYEGDEAQIEEDLRAFFKKALVLHHRDVQRGRFILTDALEACRKDGAVLIRDRFLFNQYWRKPQPPGLLQAKLNREAMHALGALGEGKYEEFLLLMFRRMSVLRNQIMHGGATYGPKSFGRGSLAKGLQVLRVMVPAFYALVLAYGAGLKWDPVPYPRSGAQSRQHTSGEAR